MRMTETRRRRRRVRLEEHARRHHRFLKRVDLANAGEVDPAELGQLLADYRAHCSEFLEFLERNERALERDGIEGIADTRALLRRLADALDAEDSDG